jgi:hypothetical protein
MQIVSALQDALDLKDGQLDAAWDCLRRVGKPVVSLSPGRARGCDEAAATGARDRGSDGRDGSRFLF